MSLSWELESYTLVTPPPPPSPSVLYRISTQKIEGKREFRSLECASKQWDILSKFKI